MKLIGIVRNILKLLDLHFSKVGSFISLLHIPSFTNNIGQLCARCLDYSRACFTPRVYGDADDGKLRLNELKIYLKASRDTRVCTQLAVKSFLDIGRKLAPNVFDNTNNNGGSGGSGVTKEGRNSTLSLIEAFLQRNTKFQNHLSLVCEEIRKATTEDILDLLFSVRRNVELYGGCGSDNASTANKRKVEEESSSVFGFDGKIAALEVKRREVTEYIKLFTIVHEWEKEELLHSYNSDTEDSLVLDEEIIDVNRPSKIIIFELFQEVSEWFACFIDHVSFKISAVPLAVPTHLAKNFSSSSTATATNNIPLLDITTLSKSDLEDFYSRKLLRQYTTSKNHRELQNAISSQPRRVVTTALDKPGFYINCKCCTLGDNNGIGENGHSRISVNMHDTCIAYKVLEEEVGGRTIASMDWFKLFAKYFGETKKGKGKIGSVGSGTAVEAAANVSEKDKINRVTNEAWLRFNMSVTELCICGLVRRLGGKNEGKYEKTALVWCR